VPRIAQTSVRTEIKHPSEAAEVLAAGLGDKPKLVLLFASSRYDHAALNRALRERLSPDTLLIGASSSGEIDANGMHEGSAMAVALSGDFEVAAGIGRRLKEDPLAAGETAMQRACEGLGVSPTAVDRKRYVGIVIDDGFQSKKDELLLGARSVCSTVTLVGGGANDDWSSPTAKGFIHLNGEVTNNAVLIALIRTDVPWAVMQTHWFQPTGRTVRVTKADPSQRTAIEIDGQPALQRYAELVGTTKEKLLSVQVPKEFGQNPFGQRLGRDYFINTPFYANKDGTVGFVGMLDTSATFEIMKTTDMAGSTRQFLTEEVPKKVPNPTAGILFHCTGRVWFAALEGQAPALGAAFKGIPWAAGLNVNFEVYRSLPVNTTLTALVFGQG
jgi:hypothetical protein